MNTWNDGQIYPMGTPYRDTADVIRESTARLQKLYDDRYQQGVRDGLNIDQNALAQEVERLRRVMRVAAGHLRHGVAKALPCWYLEAAEALESGMGVPDPQAAETECGGGL